MNKVSVSVHMTCLTLPYMYLFLETVGTHPTQIRDQGGIGRLPKAEVQLLSHFHYPFFLDSTPESIISQHGQCAQKSCQVGPVRAA